MNKLLIADHTRNLFC